MKQIPIMRLLAAALMPANEGFESGSVILGITVSKWLVTRWWGFVSLAG
ncbi:hypothetical protein [Pedosphaera parvula]|uniref:Uncharacterized protein n=1 Tax=Pedosphaera parvula (strain Ellin514) TaxID=320771 RepID=B9XAL2_PEDPL|nr:hypothetical protein [Pedosphaera parvula]EEF63047.1 hypothetical protein Cflav_PD5682 [Pedosphaera parvula Ellin514]